MLTAQGSISYYSATLYARTDYWETKLVDPHEKYACTTFSSIDISNHYVFRTTTVGQLYKQEVANGQTACMSYYKIDPSKPLIRSKLHINNV